MSEDDIHAVRGRRRRVGVAEAPRPRPAPDMADIIDVLLATGCRLGEVLALRWTELDLEATPPTLTVNGTIKTETGKGTYRNPSRSRTPRGAPWRSLTLLPRCCDAAGTSSRRTRWTRSSPPATARGTR